MAWPRRRRCRPRASDALPHDLQILGFGASAIDDIIYVDRLLQDGKGRVVRRERDYGGNVATALVAAARLGGRAGFIGWLSEGGTGDASIAELERHGVETSFAPRRPDALPIRSTVIVGPNGDRFIAYDDDVPHGTADTLGDDVLARARILLIDGYAIHAATVVARARDLGLTVVADIEWSAGPATHRLMDLCDHLVLPFGFARLFTGADDAAVMLSRLWSDRRSAVVLTDGARGAYVRQRDDDAMWHVPAHLVTPIDTTGAGDCFHGAYAVALADGKSPLDCALFAAAASAIAVTGHGGRRALPDRRQCLALMGGAAAPVPVPISPATGQPIDPS